MNFLFYVQNREWSSQEIISEHSQEQIANNNNPNQRNKLFEKNRQFQQGNNKQAINKFILDKNNKLSKQLFNNQRMMNRPQFIQNSKISIHPLYGLPDNYSYN